MVLHEDTVKGWDNEDEAAKQARRHRCRSQQTQGQFSDADESCERQEDRGSHDGAQSPVREVFLDLEHRAVSRLAVPQVGQRDTEKVMETVSVGVVAVIISALAAEPQVPFP